MKDTLGRELGLYAVITVSVGAMIGSGIFVLPGLAESIAGPAVILAYLLAGVIVLPSALSKAEMATAMPEAGGTYLFIDRALGPAMGTVAGLGAWFSLVFKSAFALVGLGAYLALFVADAPVQSIALALGFLLVLVNVLGVRQAGRLQAVIVTFVLGVLVAFVARGALVVQSANYQPFMPSGWEGLLATTGFVFVSYAGVTKIASIAEEVDDPGRIIPLGILISVGTMMVLYTWIVFVIVGVTQPGQLGDATTPMAIAAGEFLGPAGATLVAVTAVLALTSMANAGILAASRYPFAMSRDGLLPRALHGVHRRFRTPLAAIGLTGGVMLLLIAVVPVLELAKLASAFQLLVFAIVNLAVIMFREGGSVSYRPTFQSPGYPWTQGFGIAASLLLIPFMGATALAGAAAILAGGTAWYFAYGRSRGHRHGAALDTLRARPDQRSLADTRVALAAAAPANVLVPVDPGIDDERLASLLRLAVDLADADRGTIHLVRLMEVPVQASLITGADPGRRSEAGWDAAVQAAAGPRGIAVEHEELLSHDPKRALANYARSAAADLVVAETPPLRRRFEAVSSESAWLMRHLPCDSVFLRNRGYRAAHSVAAVAGRGPFDAFATSVAQRLAAAHGGEVRLLQALGPRAGETRMQIVRAYHDALGALLTRPVSSRVERDPRPVRRLGAWAEGSDLVVVSAPARRMPPPGVGWSFEERVADRMRSSVLLVHARADTGRTALGDVLERVLS